MRDWFLVFLLPLVACGQTAQSDKRGLKFWPQFRGPLGTGEAPGANPPIQWNEDKNVRWKIPLPGHGLSTPVLWNDRLFLTTAAVSYTHLTLPTICSV